MIYTFNERWYTALNNKGWWNAATNSPTIVSWVGQAWDFYIVETAGSTNIDGISTWQAGDWIFFDNSSNTWKKADNASTVWPQWPQWFQGDTGPQWLTGSTWPQWPQWFQWDLWLTGPQWTQWFQGNQWVQWNQWPQWTQWPQWFQWPQGWPWPQWPQGDTWPQWPQWSQGFQWNQWNQGFQWFQWVTWDTWPQWPQWNQGFQWDEWPAGWPTVTYKFSTDTTFPASSGYVKLSTWAFNTSAQLNISETDHHSNDVSWWINNIPVGAVLKIMDKTDVNSFVFYSITSITDNGTDVTLWLTYLAGWTFFINNANILVSYSVSWATWPQGPQWFQWNQGIQWAVWSQGPQWDSANAQLFTWFLA